MITGFCFSTPGKDIEVLHPDECGDFNVLLDVALRNQGIRVVAMYPDFLIRAPILVEDILRSGRDIVVVDSSWSPLDMEKVIPVLVHRNLKTFAKHYPNVVCCGSLITDLMRMRSISEIQVKYIPEGDVLQPVDMSKKSGWGVVNTTADKNGIPLGRIYKYRPERDYEIVEKKKK